MSHQFSLFGYVKPKRKVPISAEAIKQAKALFLKGDQKGSATKLREVREKLEDFLNRIK
jgi:hypothetical protein